MPLQFALAKSDASDDIVIALIAPVFVAPGGLFGGVWFGYPDCGILKTSIVLNER
jgi:hypothetical protein